MFTFSVANTTVVTISNQEVEFYMVKTEEQITTEIKINK